MSVKLNNRHFQIDLTSTDLSASLTSLPLNILDYNSFSISLTWTGTPIGFMRLQVCNDLQDPTTLSTWEDLRDTELAILGINSHTYNISSISSKWLRLSYTYMSGTGTMVKSILLLKDKVIKG